MIEVYKMMHGVENVDRGLDKFLEEKAINGY